MILSHVGKTTIFILIQAFGIVSVDWEEEFFKTDKN